jgi:hypothetical protein
MLLSAWIFGGTVLPNTVFGEDLKNLMDSRAMREFEGNVNGTAKGMGVKGNDWTRGMDPNANFTVVWETHDSSRVLLNWLGTKLSYYHSKRDTSGRNRDHVWASTELTNDKRVVVVVTVLVPHPSIRPLVETKVFNLFRKYRPPTLEAISEKTYELKGAKGTLYEAKSGRCSMVIDAAEYSLVNIETEKCKDAAVLVDIAQSLDFERLNRKLSS